MNLWFRRKSKVVGKPNIRRKYGMWMEECPLGVGVGNTLNTAWANLTKAVTYAPAIRGVIGFAEKPESWSFVWTNEETRKALGYWKR